jgi:hemoglobin
MFVSAVTEAPPWLEALNPEQCAAATLVGGRCPRTPESRSAIVVAMGVRSDLRDIDTRADCERLVRVFYGRALADPIIGWIFVDIAELDVEAHVPRIASFWETILLGSQSYAGGAFAPHAALNARVRLRAGHFERWLALWRATVDELFVGERAELAKAHAVRVAQAFQRRLQTLPDAAGSGPAPGAISVTWHGPPQLDDGPSRS